MEKLEQNGKESISNTAQKMVKYGVFSGPYFPLFGHFSRSGRKCIKMGSLFRFFMYLLSVSS